MFRALNLPHPHAHFTPNLGASCAIGLTFLMGHCSKTIIISFLKISMGTQQCEVHIIII